MAKPTPASITFMSSEGDEQVIRFHAVIKEGHKASSDFTKFPVQEGFDVTNHAIRRNRVVDINGIFSNTLLEGAGMIQYSKENNSKEMFKTLEGLVLNSVKCKVITNLGVYDPVYFNNFSTAQKEGLTDALLFDISGEEVQIASLAGSSAPKALSFTPVDRATAEQLEAQWVEAGLPYSSRADISQATVLLGTDFSIDSKDSSGAPTVSTFECIGYDEITGIYSYLQHNSMVDAFQEAVAGISDLVSPSIPDMLGGLLGTSNCLLEGAASYVGDVVDNTITSYIKTAMGEMRGSLYGVLQDVINLGGSQLGQSILGFTVDCVISQAAEAVGFEETTAQGVIEGAARSIETKGEELLGAASQSIRSFKTTSTTITKIAGPSGPMATLGITK